MESLLKYWWRVTVARGKFLSGRGWLLKLIESLALARSLARAFGLRRGKLFNECQLRAIHSDKWCHRRAICRLIATLGNVDRRRFRYCKSSGGTRSVLGTFLFPLFLSLSCSLFLYLVVPSDIGHFVKRIEVQFPVAPPSIPPLLFHLKCLWNFLNSSFSLFSFFFSLR